ncbi:CoA-transferase, partial [Bacillus sp. D-CC]
KGAEVMKRRLFLVLVGLLTVFVLAGEITIVEAEEIVPLGSLDPEEIVVPGVFVNYIVPSEGVNWKWVWA